MNKYKNSLADTRNPVPLHLMNKKTNGNAGPNLKNAAQNGGMSLTATLTTTALLAQIKTSNSIQKRVAVEIGSWPMTFVYVGLSILYRGVRDNYFSNRLISRLYFESDRSRVTRFGLLFGSSHVKMLRIFLYSRQSICCWTLMKDKPFPVLINWSILPC